MHILEIKKYLIYQQSENCICKYIFLSFNHSIESFNRITSYNVVIIRTQILSQILDYDLRAVGI